jgi:UDP-3-O-[3-hydroxymyristoyl] glucosamine N-acyltransferase
VRISSYSLGELARLVGGELSGDPDLAIRAIAGLEDAQPGDLSFVTGPRYLSMAEASSASAFVVPPKLDLPGRSVIRVAQPSLAIAAVAAVLYPAPRPAPGVHPTAVIATSARVAPEASVLAFAVVGDESVVEAHAVLHAHVAVGERCRVGSRSVLHPHVVLRADVDVGQDVVIHAGSVLGSDGFGYVFDGARHAKIPQVGRVVVEDEVEIGANVTIDRATFGQTIIGRGTKIDNLVQIGHNTVIGSDTIIVAQTGVSGSCRIGNRVLVAGQAGLVDHVTVGDGAQIGSQAGVTADVPAGAAVLGSPAIPAARARRALVALPQIPELMHAVRRLERQVAALEQRLATGRDEGG